MKHIVIYPNFKVVIRFAVIMAFLLAFAMATVCPLLNYIIITFFVSFFFVVLFSYSFHITISDVSVKIYQFFIPFSNILIADIKDVYYTPWANNGQGAALVISLKGNKEKIFPVRLYGKDKTDNIILILTKRLEKKNSSKMLTTTNRKNFFKYLIVIGSIIIISKIITHIFK